MTKTVYFAYGRMNPPTRGHEKLIDTVLATSKMKKANHLIAITRGRQIWKNEPLTVETRYRYIKGLYPNANIEKGTTYRNTFFDWLHYLNVEKGYTDLVLVAGSDRMQQFLELANKYNDKKSDYVPYNFKNISSMEIQREIGVSATNMRLAVYYNDMEKFNNLCPIKMPEDTRNKFFSDIKRNA